MIAPNAQERLTQIVEPLLFWYQKNKRSLPWRDQPTPYRVWVSEIMLQQTRVEAVKPYFERFLSQPKRLHPVPKIGCSSCGKVLAITAARAICKKPPACWSNSTADSFPPTTDS